MTRIVLIAVMSVLCVSTAQAIELSLVGDDDWGLEVGLSETDFVRVHLVIGDDDGNVSFMNAFFDATPVNDGSTAGYDVVGREFKMTRNDGSGWFRAIGWDGSNNMEDYALIAADDEGDPIGTDGPWEGDMDSIIIHGTQIGEYELFYENQWTKNGAAARPPQLFDRELNQKVYANNLDLPGFIHFRNAWVDDNVNFRRSFEIFVIPEPASVVLLLCGAGLVAPRRARVGHQKEEFAS